MTNFLHISPGNLDRHKRQLSNIRDVVFVMDGSLSVGDCEFGKGKKAIKYMMGVAKEKGIDGKYAAVTFASSAKINFKFLPYATAGNKILSISYPDGMTNTQAGLVEAKKPFNDPFSGKYNKYVNMGNESVNGVRRNDK